MTEIADSDDVRRHISPNYVQDDGTWSSAAFSTSDMSVDLCRLRTLTESMAASPGFQMAELGVAFIRSINLDVVYKPLKDDPNEADNPAHCEIPGRTTKSQARRLRDAARKATPPK